MKKNIVFNKYYRELQENVFDKLEMKEFIEVYTKFKKLSIQYRILCVANKLEKFNFPVIEVPILRFLSMLVDFIRWKIYDLLIFIINGRTFNLYGVSCFCGRQGSGKTIGVVEELERIKRLFPECIICTNINYLKQDIPLVSWLQLLELRNGDKGVVFVIDEVQNNGLDWTKFPETLLSVITQQRKQKIKIYVTSQVYKNLVIQLRRQCFDVIECKTFLGRWTRHKCYDAEEYNNVLDNPTPEKKLRMHRKYKHSFIQSNFLRNLYDTNQVVTKLKDYDKLLTDERIEKINSGKKLFAIKVVRGSERNV